MGCCESTEAVQATPTEAPPTNPGGGVDIDDLKIDLAKAEARAGAEAAGGPEIHSFLYSVLQAREVAADDAGVMEQCCTGLQAHNRKLKSYIATADAEAIHEAMNGGFLGLGCNHRKLIAVLCSRTKAQLEQTKKRYRGLYDLDVRDEVKGETGGAYGKMMSYAMASRSEYVADMIDLACGGRGCNETVLLELFVMCDQEWLKAGKAAWEGRTDKSLIDYLTRELGSSYSGLCSLLLMLLKGDRSDEADEADDAKAEAQAEALREETQKGMFQQADEDAIVNIIGANNITQNARVAELYENKYNESLAKGLRAKCGEKLASCLCYLLLTRPRFIAARLEHAICGWSTDKGALTRLLGGLDGQKMVGVLDAYEDKYGRPLAVALNGEIGGNFGIAALTWLRSINDPSRGMEELTEGEISERSGDAPKLAELCDCLLLENETLLRFVSSLDVETLREAVKGWSTDDTVLIRTLATRSKQFLGRLSYMYREAYGESVRDLVDSELKSWYAYLAKFLVLQPSQADALLLDLALEGSTCDKNALIEFLCARHPRRVRLAKKAWEARNDASLVDRLSDELSGDLRTICLTMLKGKRTVDETDEDKADVALAKTQAAALNDDPESAIAILCCNSPAQNAAIATAYENQFDESLGRKLGNEFNGNVKAALTALLVEPAQWYAARLRASFKGMGTSDRTVCRIVGAHDKDEIAEIARAYDARYGRRLKSDIADECSGNYKRLAIAWVDLPDQLKQPDQKVELPTAAEVPNELGRSATARRRRGEAGTPREKAPEPAEAAAVVSDGDDSDEELCDEPPDPTSPLYRAKIVLWTGKLAAAEAACKKRKIDYYRRLLVMYPPLPSGHHLLAAYADALVAEYEQNEDQMTDAWIASCEDSDFEKAGTTKATFDEWQNTSERLVKDKAISINELKHAWGVTKKPEKLPEPAPEEFETPYAPPQQTPAPAPLQIQMPTAVARAPQPGVPVPQPGMPQPGVPMVQQPGVPMVQAPPVQQQFYQQQQAFQQTMVYQQPRPQVQAMAVTVPFGIYGGQRMTVNTTQGPMMVTVPPGYGPGSTFTFHVPRLYA